MRYPTAVKFVDGTYSASVPDLPGLTVSTHERALVSMKVAEAAQKWMRSEIDAGRAIPVSTGAENYLGCPEYEECDWILVDIDLSHLEESAE